MKVSCEQALNQISTMAAMLHASRNGEEQYGADEAINGDVEIAVRLFAKVRTHVEKADAAGKYRGEVAADSPGEYPA